MKKLFLIAVTISAALIYMSFAESTPVEADSNEYFTENLSDYHDGNFDVLTDYLGMDEIVDVENVANADGTFKVTVTGISAGKTYVETLEAFSYSPDGSCTCIDCNTFVPHVGFKRKVVIGTKCWCFACLDIPKKGN